MNMASQPSPAEIKNRALTDNTAQSVLNHLTGLESNRARMRTRWIWELLQNARDTSANADTRLVASVEHGPNELIFQHNGPKFDMYQIVHLIYHGSTKVEDEGTIGQYGSGFLTTHLLSPEIDVSGQLDDGRVFEFRLKRAVGSVKELRKSMDKAWDDFNGSLSDISTSDEFTTRFHYPIEADAAAAVKDGLETLKQCAPFVIVFNQEFSSIGIKADGETINYEVGEESRLPQDGLWKITVTENQNGNRTRRVYLLAKSERTSVAIPLEPMADCQRCLPVGNAPRLFKGFPLIGTENFSFPAVINSLSFSPTENRDGVYLGQSVNDANRENQAIIQEACELLVTLLRFAAESGWHNAHELANVPAIYEQNWLNSSWLRENIEDHLIEKIRQTPAVLNEAGAAISPKKSRLPFVETDMGVEIEALWDLLDGWRENSEVLPRRNESVGWCNAVKSWASVSGCEASLFSETRDGRKLASYVDQVSHDPSVNPRTHRVKRLDDCLKESVDAIDWLDQLNGFLRGNGLGEIMREYRIVPSQEGFLRQITNLHRDQDIDEELKDVADLLEWRIRCELRDTRLTSLAEETGVGDWENAYVVRELIEKLQNRAATIEKLQEWAATNPDANFAKASARFFAWIVHQKDWERLRGFPVFAEEGGTDNRRVIRLKSAEEDDERPLAPVRAWSEDLQPYSELFPRRYIVANAFFEAAPDPDIWQTLDKEGFLRKDVIINQNVYFGTFLPDEPLTDEEHKTAEQVNVTDIAFITRDDIGIMARVRQSQRLARIFWRFLTEWLIVHDSKGLETNEALCSCKEIHRYYPAEWLTPVVKNRWIPLEGRRADQASAESLASLLRGSEFNTGSLIEAPAVMNLLEAMGVTGFDLMRELVAETEEDRAAVDKKLLLLMNATRGDLDPIFEFTEDLENDPGILDHLAERREKRRRVHENRQLGEQVEDLVKESLEGGGFTVRRTGVGSDFEIEYNSAETGDVTTLELSRSDRSWLIEVKATRGQEVQMTDTQARTAVKEGDRFLLCVVPVEPENTLPELDSGATMWFVASIDTLVAPLCDKLNKLVDYRKEITAAEASGVQLAIASGAARIRVARSVWENDGFGLEDLAERLGVIESIEN